jgi:hypothetical protein
MGGMDFDGVAGGRKEVSFRGHVTVHPRAAETRDATPALYILLKKKKKGETSGANHVTLNPPFVNPP